MVSSSKFDGGGFAPRGGVWGLKAFRSLGLRAATRGRDPGVIQATRCPVFNSRDRQPGGIEADQGARSWGLIGVPGDQVSADPGSGIGGSGIVRDRQGVASPGRDRARTWADQLTWFNCVRNGSLCLPGRSASQDRCNH